MATRSRRRRIEEAPPPPVAATATTEEEAPAVSIEDLLAKPDPEANWYVIHTYSGYETKVKKNLDMRVATQGLQDQIFRIIVPTEDEVEVHGGQRRTVTRKVFPGYILVMMRMTDDAWSAVRNTQGVTGFISAQGEQGRLEPLPLVEDEVRRILRRMESETPRVRAGFSKGQAVRIIDGPFVDFVGTVDEVYQEKGKVSVLVSFFGRETPVELDLLQIEKL
ncbi:MAG TPA: transcription termination/antitermination protein NusG [Dehalococcoidia bacterium]|nr:transcription termination/antitermination protein NusG [Dehalococcoidia bacterium]